MQTVVEATSVPRTGTAAPAVELHGVSKTFRMRAGGPPWRRGAAIEKVALRELSMEMRAGGITGIIGVNGSGKSTLIRILATLMVPDTGIARVFGHDVVAQADTVRRHINRVSVEAAFFKELSPWENLHYAARLYGTVEDARPRAESVLRRLGLALEAMDRPMKQLSRGQQQKVAIARSFLTSPSLLLMDEPTTGLDPHSKRDVQRLISVLRDERDVTIVLCTHDLAEAQALCDRIVILEAGAVVADAAPAELCAGGRDLEEVFLRMTGHSIDDDTEGSG
ncbi:MAG TPA: ABC transporter ATP-binding protein [Candidatus Dormibacteraeota bacterium]|jgi:ABC-2 type transport system ATP-binding protein|nr:ABC transporter ATP-binding protein [Candidatus Dormibacteraeota bacterium]